MITWELDSVQTDLHTAFGASFRFSLSFSTYHMGLSFHLVD